MTWREHPDAPEPGAALCRIEAIPDGEGKELVFGAGKWPLRLFIVRRRDALFGYVNTCPHLHITLNYFPDRFTSHDRAFILCANHRALFQMDDGYCVSGPCAGQSLEPVPIVIQDGEVLLR